MSGPARSNSAGRGVSPRQREATVFEMYRGRARLALIRDLALGEWSNREIASQLGVPQVEVSTFAAQHADEITEVRSALAGHLAIDTAGMWVSKRHNRVAEYQFQIQKLEEDIDTVRETHGPGSKEHVNVVRTWAILMSKVADEYLPTRVDRSERENGKVVRYVVEADDYLMQGLK